MKVGEYMLAADCVSKFHNSLFVSGWFHHEVHTLKSIELLDRDVTSSQIGTTLPHGGVERDLGPDRGFFIQVLRSTNKLSTLAGIQLAFVSSDDTRIYVPLQDLIVENQLRDRSSALSERFVSLVRSSPGTRLLDVGGRSRSKLDRTKQFPGTETVVLDILPGENVDIVGDAHEIGKLFPESYFDFVYSVSVFEHLAMPWRVACELNRAMKLGAIGLIHTHQTIGMHDVPWDFYRFSDTAWAALFNRHTGFQLIEAVVDEPQFVVPFLYKVEKENAERSCGFESSTVMFKKVGPCTTSWDVPLEDIIETVYPES